MINGIVIAAGIGGGYFFTVIVQGGSAGAFLSSSPRWPRLPDLYISMVKAVIFGWLAAIVGAYKGLNAGGGPSGVGRAVNEAVIIAFMLLFFLNAVITAIYFQVVPQHGLVAWPTITDDRQRRSSGTPRLGIEQYGDQLLFYVKALAWTPARDQALPARDLQHPRRGGLRRRRA